MDYEDTVSLLVTRSIDTIALKYEKPMLFHTLLVDLN